MNRKLFIVSDVHGFYSELMTSLRDAGFDESNEKHFFVSCGDLFDRGTENLSVYNFVKTLKRKILLKGNHEDNLIEAFKVGKLSPSDKTNGTEATVRELLGDDSLDLDGKIDVNAHAERIREITDFVDSMSDYYENDSYVLTHGWLPIVFVPGERNPRVDPDWRNASRNDWHVAHQLEWQQMYPANAMLEGKTIVCGHRPASIAHNFDDLRENDCSDIFFARGLIAIDAWTVRSGRVNVLTLEE